MYWKGKKRSPQDKEKMRQAKLKNPTRYWLGRERPDMSGLSNPNYGKFGPNHPKWTDLKKKVFDRVIRTLHEYRLWRSDVFTKDDFTCQKCFKRVVYLQADHFPVMFHEILARNNITTVEQAVQCQELWNVSNGRTLCKDCHYKYGPKYRYRSKKIVTLI